MFEQPELLARLEKVEPALSSSDFVPALKHFWLTGDALMAYNNQIAISTPLSSEFVGCLPGAMFINLIRTFPPGGSVSVKPDGGGHAVIKCGATVKLAMLASDSLFDIPAFPAGDADLLSVAPGLLRAVEDCMRSVSAVAIVSDQLGVTLMPGDGKLHACATDKTTLVHSPIATDGDSDIAAPVILSGAFCQQMLKLANGAAHKRLVVRDDHALFVADGSTLFGHVVQPSGQVDYWRIIDAHVPSGYENQLVQTPPEFAAILERAALIGAISGREVSTDISCRNGKIRFRTTSERGEVVDDMTARGHPDVQVKLRSSLLQRGAKDFTWLLFTEQCAIMANEENTVFLVAATEN
jgi:DNA polymerase III sliding clamp (beta) subunit (PCNA family)